MLCPSLRSARRTDPVASWTAPTAHRIQRLTVALAVMAVLTCRSSAAETPNFVVFLADDQGWGDLGCYGHPKLQTPNIDRFATQGMRFTQCYAGSAFCSPSRSAILTGRTPYRNGVFTWIPERDKVHLRTSEITIASLLRKQGYATCHVGKWHLNGFFNSPEQPQPDAHGYDHWFATQNNAAPNHKNPVNFVRNGKPVGPLEGYSSILVVEEAIAWLRQRDRNEPFFLTVWTHEPHLPIESDPQFMKLYEGDDDLKQHHGNISQLDHAFGMLMSELKDQQIVDDTFVIYTSDNGPEGRLDEQGYPRGRNKRTRGSTGGLRGRKRDMYEGGIRVPGIVSWPGHVTPASVSSEPIIGSDIFTTICEITGTPLPQKRIDGASILPALRGEPIQRSVPMYWRCYIAQGPRTAMRIGDWKILADEALTEFELYNIADDPQEQHDLVGAQPQKFQEMQAALRRLNAEIEAEGPDWWKNYRRPGQRQPRRRNQTPPRTKVSSARLFAPENLVAWCIVPFDASQRGPRERAAMLRELGLKRVAYDWRAKHVPTFEQEILAYKEHGLEYFAFWGQHPEAFALFEKHGLHPQIWQTNPSPPGASQQDRIDAAVARLKPLVDRTRAMGCPLGLYNHGGWGGQPENLAAVCRQLHEKENATHVGIVYNFHHAHDRLEDFGAALKTVQPWLLCLNINGMNDDARPKILPVGQGQHDRRLLQLVLDSGYRGPIGILDHRNEVDAAESLRANLEGLKEVLSELPVPSGSRKGR